MTGLPRRAWLGAVLLGAAGTVAAGLGPDGDPFDSGVWPDLRSTYLGSARVVHDSGVVVEVPAFAEDPMNVPVSVRVSPALGPVQRILVLVDRNPIRRVLDFEPLAALPQIALRFKLEQASPVRAAVLLADGSWHVGSAWVDSAGGGCTVAGATRQDGSWAQTLGQTQAKWFARESGSARLRLRVMHPMDTGLAAGIPAFYVKRLSVQDGAGRELARLSTYEPVSENPVFSVDFASPPAGGVRIVGLDNNGNRIAAPVAP